MFEMLVAIDVTDDDGYQAYRDAMTPLLEQIGGTFRYDFTVADTLRNAADHDVNRVFTIAFPDAAARDRFFNDPTYLEIRQRHFDRSVRSATVIAEYDLTGPD